MKTLKVSTLFRLAVLSLVCVVSFKHIFEACYSVIRDETSEYFARFPWRIAFHWTTSTPTSSRGLRSSWRFGSRPSRMPIFERFPGSEQFSQKIFHSALSAFFRALRLVFVCAKKLLILAKYRFLALEIMRSWRILENALSEWRAVHCGVNDIARADDFCETFWPPPEKRGAFVFIAEKRVFLFASLSFLKRLCN